MRPGPLHAPYPALQQLRGHCCGLHLHLPARPIEGGPKRAERPARTGHVCTRRCTSSVLDQRYPPTAAPCSGLARQSLLQASHVAVHQQQSLPRSPDPPPPAHLGAHGGNTSMGPPRPPLARTASGLELCLGSWPVPLNLVASCHPHIIYRRQSSRVVCATAYKGEQQHLHAHSAELGGGV